MKLGGSYIAGERQSRLRTPPVQDRLRQARNARIGLGLLICGFVLQMISYIMNTPPRTIELAAIDVEKTVDLFNAIAACVGIIGAGMLFKFVPAESNFETHGAMGVEDANVNAETGRTYGEERAEMKARWLRYVKWSRIGFGIVVAGFVIQLIASAVHGFAR